MRQSQKLMLIGAMMLISLFFLPMWNITLEAPQYPEPIGMDIHINKFKGSHENDIKNINIMNHYVGMQDIPEKIPEFEIFPYFAIGMIVLGLIFGFIGNRKLYVAWFVIMLILGIIAMYDFYLWEYDYGHNLDPKAIMSFKNPDGSPMGFQPPLLGTKHILNFIAHSYPRGGAYMMFVGMLMTLAAFFVGKKEARTS